MGIPNETSHIRETGTTNLSSNIQTRSFSPMTSAEMNSILASINTTLAGSQTSGIEVGNSGVLDLSAYSPRVAGAAKNTSIAAQNILENLKRMH